MFKPHKTIILQQKPYSNILKLSQIILKHAQTMQKVLLYYTKAFSNRVERMDICYG